MNVPVKDGVFVRLSQANVPPLPANVPTIIRNDPSPCCNAGACKNGECDGGHGYRDKSPEKVKDSGV